MGRRKWYMAALAILVFSLFLGFGVQAIAINPFGKGAYLPDQDITNVIVCSSSQVGCDYITPVYDQEIQVAAYSTDPTMATVKVYSFREGVKGVYVEQKGYGEAEIGIAVKVDQKVYRKTISYCFQRYENPFAEIKIDEVDYTDRFDNPQQVSYRLPATSHGGSQYIELGSVRGRLRFKLKEGYKIKTITAYRVLDEWTERTKDYKSWPYRMEIKNYGTIPQGYELGGIEYQDTRTKATGYISIQ